MEEQPIPVQQEVPDNSPDIDLLEEPAAVDKRSIEQGEEQQPKVPRLSEQPRGEEVLPQGGQVVGTTSSSSSTHHLHV